MTMIYLATCEGDQLKTLATYAKAERKPRPLVSFFYLQKLMKLAKWWADLDHKFDMILDSGAYSAWKSGKNIDIMALIDESRSGRWTWTAALDIIGDGKSSLANARAMTRAGAKVVPTFHYGDDWDILSAYLDEFDKIALGGMGTVTNITQRVDWIGECFSRAWPRKMHLFGWVVERILMQFPFHSADSSSWAMSCQGYGRFAFANGQNLGLRRQGFRTAAGGHYLKPEIERYMDIERRVAARWGPEFRKQGWL